MHIAQVSIYPALKPFNRNVHQTTLILVNKTLTHLPYKSHFMAFYIDKEEKNYKAFAAFLLIFFSFTSDKSGAWCTARMLSIVILLI
jgi:hypothetical protein